MLASKKKARRRLSLNMQIIAFSALFLMALPWLGFRYMEEMKEFLVKGQGESQLLAAQAIATVLHNRADLFNVSNLPDHSIIEESSLYVYPLEQRITVDGYSSDWNILLSQNKQFGSESLIYDRTAGHVAPASFGLLLGERDKYLYGLISVKDDNIVYRHPGYARLDNSDQIRIEFINETGELKRYLLITESIGRASVYEMHKDWKKPITGQPIYTLNAIWLETAQGYDVEFKLPINWLNSDQHLMISVVDVNSKSERQIDNVVATLSSLNSDSLNKLIIRSADLDRILKGLDYADSNVCIVDKYRRVRAVLGSHSIRSELCTHTDKIAPELVAKAMLGESSVVRIDLDSGDAMVLASHPIYQNKYINGAVLVEKK